MSCSVVVCTHNGEHFLAHQLNSIIEQSIRPDEIIISDDASTDGTVGIIERFLAQAATIRVPVTFIQQSCALGITANFEFVARKAKGEIVLLSDQDDVWTPTKIERILREFDNPDVMMVASDAMLIDANGREVGETLLSRLNLSAVERSALENDDLSQVGPNRNLFTGATMAIRRVALHRAFPFTQLMHHDDWIAQVAWMTGECRMLFEPLIQYRLHANNAIGINTEPLVPLAESPRRAHLMWQASRLDPIASFIAEQSVSTFRREDRAKLRLRQHHHLLNRLSMPGSFVRRIQLVIKLWRTGFYNDFHRGWHSAIADVIRPA